MGIGFRQHCCPARGPRQRLATRRSRVEQRNPDGNHCGFHQLSDTDSHEEAIVLRNRAMEVFASLADGGEKTEPQELISALDTALSTRDEEAIDESQDELLDLLYDLEE